MGLGILLDHQSPHHHQEKQRQERTEPSLKLCPCSLGGGFIHLIADEESIISVKKYPLLGTWPSEGLYSKHNKGYIFTPQER